ncbi:LOW QUALITY PROTEIN: inactive polypeptide N-acetylgalactosaminyltransferase-like protein 5 [Condylostylus longicornis]|uniref:LOW QUALITY PROTEIN: inactive polypeptide N-acetylgalactosaminyltransferase-like protein 5 n=1 Tax=Condylostylus longicornis TaxID=2530218 RepID=UPI00244DBE72|nr:LOW QUALITY PROTEIN: inactive polypeptide N-acetylgalactosaminyltransferase-like protein 5 [Condylostylus longicornis]
MLPTQNRRFPVVSDLGGRPGKSQRHRFRCSFSSTCVVQIFLISLVVFWLVLNISYLRKSIDNIEEPTSLRRAEEADPSGFEASNLAAEKLQRARVEELKIRLHGKIGLREDGSPGWQPNPVYSPGAPMDVLLKKGGGFNLKFSDALPLDRDVADSRHPECRGIHYHIERLPSLSVIIVFYNEPLSTLFRSVHSVLNGRPPQLLKEIILVDDGSDLSWIRPGGQIDDYIRLLPKTRLVRSPTRKGIVSARMLGIRASSAPIFVILDSHIEVNEGWAEPLSQRIHEDRTRILMPQIDATNPETFEPHPGGIGCTLGFLWKLIEHGFYPDYRSPKARRNASPTDFVSSPTMAGGLFAANRDFFLNDLGGYDEQFSFWGTENLELSFRTWMCGGTLECAPCSRVYHIFRKGGVGYSSPPDAVTKNKMRLLTIWMDEFGDLAWRVIGQPRVDFGDYETLRKWRRTKQCRSFSWFLKVVNPESDVQELPADVPYLGPLKNVGTGQCLDTLWNDTPGKPVGLRACNGGSYQEWMYFARPRHILPVNNDESCLSGGGTPKANQTDWCEREQASYDYNSTTKLLKLGSEAKCLGAEAEQLHFVVCNPNDTKQQWEWKPYNPSVFTPPPPPGLRGGG